MMKTQIKQRILEAEQLCREAKVRFTPIRRDLLTQIYEQDTQVTAYDLLRLLRPAYPNIEAMTIYRALDFLQKQQLIHRVASQNAYTACDTPRSPHHAQLLLCEGCGHAEEVNALSLEKALQSVAREKQFLLSDKPTEIIGACKNCRAQV